MQPERPHKHRRHKRQHPIRQWGHEAAPEALRQCVEVRWLFLSESSQFESKQVKTASVRQPSLSLMSQRCHRATPAFGTGCLRTDVLSKKSDTSKCVSVCVEDRLRVFTWLKSEDKPPQSSSSSPHSPADCHKHGIVGRQRDGQCWSQLRGHWRRCTEATWRRPLCTLEIAS